MMEIISPFITDDCEQGKGEKYTRCLKGKELKLLPSSTSPSPTLGPSTLPGIWESGSWARMSDHFSSGWSQEGRRWSNSHSLFRRKQAAQKDRGDSQQSLTEFYPPVSVREQPSIVSQPGVHSGMYFCRIIQSLSALPTDFYGRYSLKLLMKASRGNVTRPNQLIHQ